MTQHGLKLYNFLEINVKPKLYCMLMLPFLTFLHASTWLSQDYGLSPSLKHCELNQNRMAGLQLHYEVALSTEREE